MDNVFNIAQLNGKTISSVKMGLDRNGYPFFELTTIEGDNLTLLETEQAGSIGACLNGKTIEYKG